jgi:HEAT repeat protein
MQIMASNPSIRHAAAFTLVARGSDAAIVSAWTQAISAKKEEVLIEIVNALFIRPDLNDRPNLVFLIEDANT